MRTGKIQKFGEKHKSEKCVYYIKLKEDLPASLVFAIKPTFN